MSFHVNHQIETQKVEWKGESKVGSLNNTDHKAGGGDKKVMATIWYKKYTIFVNMS